ncbi:MAG: hypothetical protein U0929_13500 [Planctomycetaceae bacterium]
MLIEEVKKLAAERTAIQTAERAKVWQEYVRRQETSESRCPEDVLNDLSEMNRTADELDAALKLFKSRADLAKQVEDGEHAKRELAGIRADIERVEAERIEALRRYEAARGPLAEREQEANNTISTGTHARRELLNTAGPESRKAVLEPFETEAAKLSQRRQEIERESHGLAKWIATVQSRGDRASDFDKAELPNALRRQSELQQEDADLLLQSEALSARRIEAERQLLDPAAIS